jgi:hypothetical protein
VDYSIELSDGSSGDPSVDVALNGTTTTFAELVGEEESTTSSEDDVLEVIARQSGELNYEFVVDGTAELHETSEQVTAGHGDDITDNGDGTVTVTGFTGNDGYGDAYLVDGTIQSFTWSPEDYAFDVLLNGDVVDPTAFGSSDEETETSTDDSTDGDATLPHRIAVNGDADDATTYTFTVSGEVARDTETSEPSADGTEWDQIEDIAKDGKVIGVVGSGLDAYRYDGSVTGITVDGDATIDVEKNV